MPIVEADLGMSYVYIEVGERLRCEKEQHMKWCSIDCLSAYWRNLSARAIRAESEMMTIRFVIPTESSTALYPSCLGNACH